MIVPPFLSRQRERFLWQEQDQSPSAQEPSRGFFGQAPAPLTQLEAAPLPERLLGPRRFLGPRFVLRPDQQKNLQARRSNPFFLYAAKMDCFASLAMTGISRSVLDTPHARGI